MQRFTNKLSFREQADSCGGAGGQALRDWVGGVGGIEKKRKRKKKHSWTWTAVWDCQEARLERSGGGHEGILVNADRRSFDLGR